MSLQAARGVAAVAVLLYHLGGVISLEKYFGITAFATPFLFADFGVEFFFVLSGFILMSAHRRDVARPNRLPGYLAKRFIRIYPIYWLVFLPVFFVALATPAIQHTVPHDWPTVVKSLMLVPQSPALVGGTGAPVIAVAWTLQYELFFYLLFSTLILSKRLFAVVVASLAVTYGVYAGDAGAPFALRFVTSDNVLLFFLGMLAYLAQRRLGGARGARAALLAAGASLFLVVSVDKVFLLGIAAGWHTLLSGGASAVIVLWLADQENGGRVIGGNRLLQRLGDASYVLYLIHFPMVSLMCKIALVVGLDGLGALGASISFLVILVSCILCAIAIHQRVERPLLAYLRGRAAIVGGRPS